jgi:hypothetical protein
MEHTISIGLWYWRIQNSSSVEIEKVLQVEIVYVLITYEMNYASRSVYKQMYKDVYTLHNKYVRDMIGYTINASKRTYII